VDLKKILNENYESIWNVKLGLLIRNKFDKDMSIGLIKLEGECLKHKKEILKFFRQYDKVFEIKSDMLFILFPFSTEIKSDMAMLRIKNKFFNIKYVVSEISKELTVEENLKLLIIKAFKEKIGTL